MTLLDDIRRAQRDAAEKAAIDSLPKELRERMDKAQAEFEAKGGCPGCGSMVLAVHYLPCSVYENDLY